ncbi:MAG: 50S ribosomal protein L3 [Candidatus Paceibacterota bacterium]
MAFIIGKKIKMDQVWSENGKMIPVTHLSVGPVVVTQIKTKEKDGYDAYQVGYDSSIKKLTKPQAGHQKKSGDKIFRILRECRTTGPVEYAVGDVIDASAFKKDDLLILTGEEKGRGFQGVVKRHGFHGGPKTHGQKNRLRAPGSLGATAPQRVLIGKKLAGRMGNETVTLRKVRVIEVNADKGIVSVKGPVPGNARKLVLIKTM